MSADDARLVVLCDVSDSVRTAAAFLLELTAALHENFAETFESLSQPKRGGVRMPNGNFTCAVDVR